MTEPVDITTASTKALADMDKSDFKHAVAGLAGPQLQKFHQLRKLPGDKDMIVRTRLRELGLGGSDQPSAKSRGLPLGWAAFAAICLLTPIIGFVLVRWLMG